MIGIKPIVMEKERALQEYKACKEALKKKRDPETIQLQKLYYHAMKGHKIIDIFEAFKFAGLNDKNEPRLAIAKADRKEIYFHKERTGTGTFSHESWMGYNAEKKKDNVKFPDKTFCEKWEKEERIKTSVPVIPVSKKAGKNLKNYYILWEVEKWDIVPKDPFLLKRITNNLFVLVEKWNLTKLEQALIRGRQQ